MFGGMIAAIIRQKVSMPWKTKRALFVGKVHKWFSRFVIIFSQLAIGTGAYHYYHKHERPNLGYALAGVSAGLFFLFLLIGEIVY